MPGQRLPLDLEGIMVLKTAAALFLAAASFGAETLPHAAGVLAHEWGTFTSVADSEGVPVVWYALGGPTKLPCFVHKSEVLGKETAITTVRMETPVIYLYA